MAKQAHILFVPFPAQGHVKPLLKLAYKVASHGMKVTFVDTGSVHSKPFATKSDKIREHNNVVFVSVSLGLHASDDQSHVENSMERGDQAGNVMELIRNISTSATSSKVTCVIADSSIGWILAELEQKLGIQTVSFSPISMGSLALACHIPRLIEAGTINKDGKIVGNDGVISLSVDIPAWKATELTWIYPRNEETEKFIFEMAETTQKTVESVEWTVCNSCFEFEPTACDLIPRSLPIGPLIETGDVERASGAAGSFWLEDTICLDWLDTKPYKSVIYVAFGSTANLDKHEFDELALGLEISGHPFLWVVRSDFIGITLPDYPVGFMERVSNQGKIIEWAPQEKVLGHPSIACFLSHCGWNSTMEGLSMGVPFLCWPAFSDQFHNASYICDIWKVGLKLNKGGAGVIERHEIKTKIELLLACDSLKVNATNMKKKARESVLPRGTSFENFEKFINYLRR